MFGELLPKRIAAASGVGNRRYKPPCPSVAILLLACGCAGLLGNAPARAAATDRARIATPAPGAPRAIGGPANGCLQGAAALPATGTGFVSIRRARQRYFGHPATLRLVEELGARANAATGRWLMVGDLSQPRGGRMSSSHRSHQHGLDVDIWFTLAESPDQAWRATPERRDPPSMVRDDSLDVNERWGSAQASLVRWAAEYPAVDRLFVHPAIKRALCREFGDAGWLRKVRPWWGHDAHVHARLICPAGSPLCEAQPVLPAGAGCGTELDWWFSPEARAPRPARAPGSEPRPPAACGAVLGAGAALR